jgi:hypothetical protein
MAAASSSFSSDLQEFLMRRWLLPACRPYAYEEYCSHFYHVDQRRAADLLLLLACNSQRYPFFWLLFNFFSW